MAKKADIVEWCERHGVALEKVQSIDKYGAEPDEDDEYYCRADMKHIIMNRRWWRSKTGQAGKLNRYTKGGLIQYIAEFEGVGLDESLRCCLKDTRPGIAIPPADRMAGNDGSDRTGLDERVRRVKQLLRTGRL